MKLTLGKFTILIILIFAVLEKSGVSAMSLIIADTTPALEKILSDSDAGTKEAESVKESTVKEVWVPMSGQFSPSPVCKSLFRQPSISRDDRELCFYPAIPTPPPNFS